MNVIGFDDGPFERDHRGRVYLVGVVCSDTRLDGVVTGWITRDGSDATRTMIELVRTSPFHEHIGAVMLQGIAVGGFNVVDVGRLEAELAVPVLVITRKKADLGAVRRALFSETPLVRPPVVGARRKWQLIENAGPLEPLVSSRRSIRRAKRGLESKVVDIGASHLWIQRRGMTVDEARRIVAKTTLHGHLPEPLRLAHLIAGAVVTGTSRGRA
jgi:uncharacterized protein